MVNASNLPPKPILAVHAGSVRRQMKLEMNHPFVLPNPGEKTSVEVSVFQQLASQLLPEDGKEETKCTIPVRRPDGTPTQVRLEIRRDGSQEEPKDGQCIQTYLEEHKVQQRIQSLIQEVLREAPEDPYKFMLQHLREIQAATPRHVRSEVEPLQPHPPDQPKPAGGRPPAPGRMLTQKQVVDKSAWKASKHVVRSVLESPRCRYLGEESIQLGVCLSEGCTRDDEVHHGVCLSDRGQRGLGSKGSQSSGPAAGEGHAANCLPQRLLAEKWDPLEVYHPLSPDWRHPEIRVIRCHGGLLRPAAPAARSSGAGHAILILG